MQWLTQAHTHACTCTHTHTHVPHAHKNAYARTHAQSPIRMRAPTYTRTRIRMCGYTCARPQSHTEICASTCIPTHKLMVTDMYAHEQLLINAQVWKHAHIYINRLDMEMDLHSCMISTRTQRMYIVLSPPHLPVA